MGEILYKMATMARLGGVSPVLLRTWERRHGLFEPHRTPGGHRLYTEADLCVLKRVKRLLKEGRSIGEVEALGRDHLLKEEAPGGVSSRRPTHRDGASRWSSDLVSAAIRLDAELASRALDQAFAALSPERAIGDVVAPAMRAIGESWAKERCGVAGEHLVSELVGTRLRGLWLTGGTTDKTSREAIVACFPDEYHALGSLTVALLLGRSHRVRWLGAALPLQDLDRACTETRPSLVLLSVSRAALLQVHSPGLADVARRHPGARFFVGGPAVTERRLEKGVQHVVGSALEHDLAGLDGAPARPRRGRSSA